MAVHTGAEAEQFKDCGLNSKSRELARLIITDKDQKRPTLNCNRLLATIADVKAKEMAKEGKVSHHGPGGTPNFRLVQSGYPLAFSKSVIANNEVESILGGEVNAQEVLDRFRNSYEHRLHLFGEHPFYLEQYEIGVGYAEEWYSPHINYWVVYIAKPETSSIEDTVKEQQEEGKTLMNPNIRLMKKEEH